jgi:copper chaperone
MNDITLKIEGMSCQHCVMRVKKAIDAVQGVSKAEVVIGQAVVSFDETKTSKKEICAAVEKAGYKIAGS